MVSRLCENSLKMNVTTGIRNLGLIFCFYSHYIILLAATGWLTTHIFTIFILARGLRGFSAPYLYLDIKAKRFQAYQDEMLFSTQGIAEAEQRVLHTKQVCIVVVFFVNTLSQGEKQC